jgi:hypothetical protein
VAATDSTGFVGSLTGGSFFAVRCTGDRASRTCVRAACRAVTAGPEVSVGGEVELGLDVELDVEVDEPWDEEKLFFAACVPGAASAWIVARTVAGDGSGVGGP